MKTKDITGALADAPIIIRRNGLYVSKVENVKALKKFIDANLPTGVFQKIECNPILEGQPLRYKLLPYVDGVNMNARVNEKGDEIPIADLAYGLGYTFSLELGLELM